MTNTTSRIIIETLIKKALKDIKESPERSTRNLVDMALNFSEGFQHSFFKETQVLLSNEKSPYYALIQDMVDNVDGERIVQLGMNLGYNSCTYGAQKIHELESEYDCNIPWTVYIRLDSNMLSENIERYDALISQGEALGIYSWMLFFDGRPVEILSLAKKHSDSAFFLFSDAEGSILAFSDYADDVRNIMFMVQEGEDKELVCDMLRKLKFPYSIYKFYNDKDMKYIICGDYLEEAEKYHPIFTCFIPSAECSAATREKIGEYVLNVRKAQKYQTVAFEMADDGILIDQIISEDACLAYFDKSGQLHTLKRKDTRGKEFNFFQTDLLEIFKAAFPKDRM